jgi:hypothetical protein
LWQVKIFQPNRFFHPEITNSCGTVLCHILNYYSPAGFEQAVIGSARPAERREMPPRGMDPHDSPQVVRYFNNYWVAPADVPWALLKFDTPDSG